jgi:membrane protein YqaA with SNARE-associated domain
MEGFVARLDEWVRELPDVTAGLGLFVVAFFDSSLLSLPEINDVLLVYFGARFPDKAFYYALMTLGGSVSGASFLYGLARWKGYTFLQKKYSKGRVESVFRLVGRYGAFAVAIPAVLPPPLPFKIFVLSSGVLGLPYPRFFTALLAGRTIRYFGEAFLAVRYGEEAILYLESNAKTVSVVAIALVVLIVTIPLLLARRRHVPGPEPPPRVAEP